MCLLTFFPDGIVPSKKAIEGLHNGAIFNSDGFGYAIVAGEHVIVRRGLNAESVINSFVAQRERFPKGPALFHSRIGTAGVISKRNCHPFYVGGDQRTVLAHNGILPKIAQPRKGDLRSDTRYLAESLLPWRLFGKPLTCKTDAKLFERWLTPYNKVVVLTTNPKFPQSSYIFNERMGHWNYGAWWSNESYYPYVSYVKAHKYPEIVKTKENCPVCGQVGGVDDSWRVCWACGFCADCEQSWSKNDCQCYIGGRGRQYFSDSTTTIGTYPSRFTSDPELDKAVDDIIEANRQEEMTPIGIMCSVCQRDILYCAHQP